MYILIIYDLMHKNSYELMSGCVRDKKMHAACD